MTRLFCVILCSTTFNASAAPRRFNRYYKRFDLLTAAFPNAFKAYVNPEYIYPTYQPKWTMNHGDHFVQIEGRLTSIGAANAKISGNPIRITSSVFLRGHVINLNRLAISPLIPPGYAYRVLFAELLLKFPDARGSSFLRTTAKSPILPFAESSSRAITLSKSPRNISRSCRPREILDLFSKRSSQVRSRSIKATTRANSA